MLFLFKKCIQLKNPDQTVWLEEFNGEAVSVAREKYHQSNLAISDMILKLNYKEFNHYYKLNFKS